MTTNLLPKVPVRFIAANDELVKSMPGASRRHDMTDYSRPTEYIMEAPRGSMYRAPANRASGNRMFRRNPDGSLAIDYAVGQIKIAIVKVRDGIQLNTAEEVALSCVFPGVFCYLDPATAASFRNVQLGISAEEQMMLAFAVADHLSAEDEYRLSNHGR